LSLELTECGYGVCLKEVSWVGIIKTIAFVSQREWLDGQTVLLGHVCTGACAVYY